jgi:hypothetical protein
MKMENSFLSYRDGIYQIYFNAMGDAVEKGQLVN